MGRAVIVGDVHGCHAELERLLDRVGFQGGDRLVLVGDFICRGPDARKVLDIMRRTGALFVLGNHEAKLLSWKQSETTVSLGRGHLEVARSLRDVDWTLLSNAPLWLDLPEHEVRVVHAGLVPGLPIEEQAPKTLLHVRTLDPYGGASDRRGTALWATQYEGPPHVVFGHNALDGLRIHPWATGLDTGCVYGGRLTALVLGEGEKVPRPALARQRCLVSEPAACVYYDPTKKAS